MRATKAAMTRSGLTGYHVISGFRPMGKRNKRERCMANHSCRSEAQAQDPQRSQINSPVLLFGPVAPSARPSSLIPSPPEGKILL